MRNREPFFDSFTLAQIALAVSVFVLIVTRFLD